MIVSSRMSRQFTTDDVPVTYNMYLQLGVDGLRGLQNFNVDDQVSSRHCITHNRGLETDNSTEVGPST